MDSRSFDQKLVHAMFLHSARVSGLRVLGMTVIYSCFHTEGHDAVESTLL